MPSSSSTQPRVAIAPAFQWDSQAVYLFDIDGTLLRRGKAVRTTRALAGKHTGICVVGDTPRDIESARANGLSVIAVATGHSSYEDLHAMHPEVCATSLADLLVATGRES
ncbi:MAG: HAD family hydrolase [Acidobacteriota bacterium]